MTSYTPEQRRVFESIRDMLIGLGVAPEMAEQTAHGRAMGFEIPEPRSRATGRTNGLDGSTSDSARPSTATEANARTNIVVGGALTLALGMDDLEFVVRPILTKGQLGTITGHPGHCKTTFFTGLCATLTLDLPFGPLLPEADGLVYIVSAEDFQGTRNRILAEAARLRLNADNRERMDARLRWVHVNTSAGAATIRAKIEADAAGRPVALIFVDTGPALFCGESENDNVELRNFVEGFVNWRWLPGNPVAVLAWHPSKGATADRLEPRGASAIKGTCDFNLTIWREDDRVTIGYTKVRAEHFDPLEGKLSSVELIAVSGNRFFAPVVTLDTEDRAERSDAREMREAIMKHLYATRSAPPSVRELAKAIKISSATVGRHLQKLASAKPPLTEMDAVSERYTLTGKGAERAKALVEQSRQAYAHAHDPG